MIGLETLYEADVLCLQEADSELLPESVGNLRLADSTRANRLGLAIYYNVDRFDAVTTTAFELKKSLHDMLFSPANADKVVSDASVHGPKQESKIEVASWYPAELISQSELAVEPDLPGEAYSGADFVQEPFKTGKLTRVTGTDYFILELQ